MKINSYIRAIDGLKPVEVEVVVTPGLSQIQILGLADKVIQESSKRIVTAILKQGFRWPAGQQAVINLSPPSLRKTSMGLDLAIALGILIESRQIPMDIFDFSQVPVYGELTLEGCILSPRDLELLNYESLPNNLVTGIVKTPLLFSTIQLKSLQCIEQRTFVPAQLQSLPMVRPPLGAWKFNSTMARLLSIVAHGEHSLLLAGDAGAGKTTAMESIVPLLRQPDEKTFSYLAKCWKLSGRELHWRPQVQPHHSSTPLAMIGGGQPPRHGEISLAHGGALLLDELLEFHPKVQSALREPMEKGEIYISRCGHRHIFPANALVVATTNLCKCGRFHPSKPQNCRCSSLQLRNYLERLSGPFLDRFAIFYLVSGGRSEDSIGVREIFQDLEIVRKFVKTHRTQNCVNEKLNESLLIDQLAESLDIDWLPLTTSRRRRLSLLRVARTIADLSLSPEIKMEHVNEATRWTLRDHIRLQDFHFNGYVF